MRGERYGGVEVQAGRPAGISRSIRSFVSAYAPVGMIVTAGIDGEETTAHLGGTPFFHTPLAQLPDRVHALLAQAEGPSSATID